jgi:hypothetical protein
VLSDLKLQPYVEEIARRFAASYISVHTGTAFNTMYRKLKGKHPGELWIALARMAIEQAQAGAAESPHIDLEELDSKGPIQ